MVNRMRRTLRWLGLCAALVSLGPTPAGAQGGDGAAPGGRGTAPLTAGEVGAMLDAYSAVQAQQALGLDDQRYPEFLARLRTLQDVRRRNRQAHLQALQDLRRLTAERSGEYDEAAIRARLMALRDLEDRGAADIRRAAEAVDQVLDPRQQARFRVFEEMIERRKLDLVLRARQKARREGSQP